ncbi:MAG: hypothetical protein K2R98_08630 [Gemmataceae bacterium]|nr:hypothetical protein [Gemmataceae bacterium]
MPITFACSACGATQRAAEHLIGRTLRCQVCSKPMTIPAVSNATIPPPAPRPAAPVAPPPEPEPAGNDEALFFHQIRKSSSRISRKRP